MRTRAMPDIATHVGAARSRVDGHAKVTGAARYAAEFAAAGLLQVDSAHRTPAHRQPGLLHP